MKSILIGSLVLFVIISSCAKNVSSASCNSDYNECAAVAPPDEVDSVAKYLNDHGILDTTAHCSGLFYKIDSLGTGKTPDVCSNITISYRGMLKDGTVFDQSNSLTYPLGKFILGFKNGIPHIKEGGKIHLYVPPSLAYGSQAVGTIPPNSVLIFEVTLISVQ